MKNTDLSDVLRPGCSPEEIALKSFFLGPQAENAPWLRELIRDVLDQWVHWRKDHYATDGRAISEADQQTPEFLRSVETFRNEVQEILHRFQSEVPNYSPRYIGHMTTEISLPALVGHMLTLLYNPNNISEEVSRVGLQVEKNAIGALLAMVGYDQSKATGHFTSGGTVANIEGALRARARMRNWIAAGASARKLQRYNGTVVEAAGMGWATYDQLMADPEIRSCRDEGTFDLLDKPFAAADAIREVFGRSYRGPVVLVPGNKHYSWNKAVDILGLGTEAFTEVKTDELGRMDVADLDRCIGRARDEGRPVMMVISVVGTTELGEVDPIDQIAEVLDSWRENEGIDIWHHVDAAYGGFFCTLRHDESEEYLTNPVKHALRAMYRANSVTIDPHKLGFVPYASGAFLSGSVREYAYTRIKAPYIDFRSDDEPGLTTVEGSRSAAGAVSTWLTSRVIGFDRHGYGRLLARSVVAARKMGLGLADAHPWIRVNVARDTNIVTYCVAREGEPVSRTNARTLALYEAFSTEKDHAFFVSKTALSLSSYEALLRPYAGAWNAGWDTDTLVMLRMVLINPFLDTKETDISYINSFIEHLVASIQTRNELK